MLQFSQFDRMKNQGYISVYMGFPHREKADMQENLVHSLVDKTTGKEIASGNNLKSAWSSAKQSGAKPSNVRIRVDTEPKKSEDSVKLYNVHKALSDHYHFNYNRKYESAISHYTSVGYIDVNDHLRNGGKLEDHKDAKDLSDALKVHKTPHAMHLFTGIKEDPRKHMTRAHEEQGHIPLHMPAFTSTSLRPSIAGSFAEHDEVPYHHDLMPKYKRKPTLPFNREKHVVVIHAPKGIHGGYVEHHSDSKGEMEFILHPGAKVHLETKPRSQKNGVNYWHGTLVHDGVEPHGNTSTNT
jgi:hypothetical protein